MQQVTEILEQDKKTEIPGLYKTSQGFLINKDNDALSAYKKRKRKERALDDMQEQINDMKSDLNEIKALLKGLAK